MFSSFRLTIVLIVLIVAALGVLLQSSEDQEPLLHSGLIPSELKSCRVVNKTDDFTLVRVADSASNFEWTLEGLELFEISTDWIGEFLELLSRLAPTASEKATLDPVSNSLDKEIPIRFTCVTQDDVKYEFELGQRYEYLDQWLLYKLPDYDIYLASARIAVLLQQKKLDFIKGTQPAQTKIIFPVDQVVSAKFKINDQVFAITVDRGTWRVNGREADEIFVLQLFKNLSGLTPLGAAREAVLKQAGEPILSIEINLRGSDSVIYWEFRKAPDEKGVGADLYLASGALGLPAFIIGERSFRRLIPREEALVAMPKEQPQVVN